MGRRLSTRPCLLTPLLALVAVSGMAQTASSVTDDVAQTGSYEFQIYAPGADPVRDLPFRRTAIAVSAVHCDERVTVAAAIAINPTTVRWRDPGNVSKECSADVSTFIRTLPVRSEPYLATLTVTNADGASSRSSPSNIFFRTAAFGEH
jgi:hypothetical protein